LTGGVGFTTPPTVRRRLGRRNAATGRLARGLPPVGHLGLAVVPSDKTSTDMNTSAPADTTASTLLMVHGGTFTSRMWDDVRTYLHAPSVAVDLPGRRYRPADLGRVTRSDWVDAVIDDVDGLTPGGVILVGHSSAGYVIPEVATARPDRIRGLIFVAATVPAHGQRPVDFLRPDLKELAISTKQFVEDRASGRTIGGLLSGEAPIDTDLEIVENEPRMGLEAPGPLFEPFSWTGFPAGIPRVFVRCLRDRVVTPELVELMVANMGGAEIIDLDAGHSVAQAAPEQLAEVLDTLAGQLAGLSG
jgi:pimeloyl-ACP methyl ester carboxylesterase